MTPLASILIRGDGRAHDSRLSLVVMPLLVASLVAIFAPSPEAAVEAALLTGAVFFLATFVAMRQLRWGAWLSFVRLGMVVAGPIAGGAGLLLLQETLGLPILHPLEFLVVMVAGIVAAIVVPIIAIAAVPGRAKPAPMRIAVVGSALTASSLAEELAHAGLDGYRIVGRIGPAESALDPHDGTPDLGPIDGLASIVAAYEIELVLTASDVPRLDVFERLARSCLHLPVRACQLSAFYESVFGHVPIGDINAAWFQYIMHPAFRAEEPHAKRAIDIALSLLACLAVLPLVPLIVLLVRSDGGPLIFRQVRIGERGVPFTVLKFRTMREASASRAQWASSDDPRITRAGRLLRLTHLDELPQLLNVLRGEMSFVGPRPEQPEFVLRLERFVPFYQRRHLVKPGITGWAQVRCGYAGSDIGSAWKLCHDLFYLKHRSLSLDLAILLETLRMIVRNSHDDDETRSVPFVLDAAALESSATVRTAPELAAVA